MVKSDVLLENILEIKDHISDVRDRIGNIDGHLENLNGQVERNVKDIELNRQSTETNLNKFNKLDKKGAFYIGIATVIIVLVQAGINYYF